MSARSIPIPARIVLAAAVVVLTLATGVEATARDDGVWPVHGRLLGKNGEKSLDVSGIACAKPQGFPRPCLVIDDNMQQAQFVTVKDGEIVAGDTIALIDNSYEGESLDLDGEAVAYAEGFYYVIGSHGHPRHSGDPGSKKDEAKIAARVAASSQIVRFRSDGDRATAAVERSAKLLGIIAQEPILAPYLGRGPEDNGLTIEGVAVRHDRILAGFRAPALSDGRSAVLSVAIDSVFGSASPGARLYRLPLGKGRGVRDLAVLGDGILVLAGPSASGQDWSFAIYWWDGESEDVKLLKELPAAIDKGGDGKAEGLLALDESASGLRVLLLFDGDKEGAPVAVDIPHP